LPAAIERGLTPRSSGAPTAGRQARSVVRYILHSPGLASHRWRPLSSNVRPAWRQWLCSSIRLAEASRRENLTRRFGLARNTPSSVRQVTPRRAPWGSDSGPPPSVHHRPAAAQERRQEEWSACQQSACPAPQAPKVKCMPLCQRSSGARFAALVQAGLTLRSIGPATASAVSPVRCTWCIIAYRAYGACLRGPVSSNVRLQRNCGGASA